MGINKAKRKAFLTWFILSCIAALSSVAILWHISYNKQHDILLLQQQIACITQETASLEHLMGIRKETKVYKSELQQKLHKVNKLTRLKQQAPVHILNELVELIPENVFLESLKLDNMDIEVSGYASEVKDIMQFLNLLEESKQFRQPNLARLGSSQEVPEREGLTPFTIKATRIKI